MALTTVNHVLLDAEQNPQAGVEVTARLMPPAGFLTAGGSEVIAEVTEVTNAAGLVTFTLIRSSEYVAAPGVYQITWDGQRTPVYITVPSFGPVNLRDVLTVPPSAGPVTLPGGQGVAGRGIASTTYNAGTGLVTVNYTDGLNPSSFTMVQGSAGAPGADFGYADATATQYAGGAVTGPTPATDPALSINAAIANALGRPAILKPGTYYCQSQIFFTASSQRLHLMEGATLVKDSTAAGTGWGTAFITHGTAVRTVKLNDLQISGPGRITTATGDSGTMVSLYGDRQHHTDYTIDGYENGLAWLLAGDQIRCSNLTLLGARTAFNPNTGLVDYLSSGGMRYVGGADFVASDCHIVSGDDALQAVPLQATFNHPFVNQSIDGVRYVNCTGRSLEARFMVVAISDKTVGGGMTCSVKDVKFIGCRGYGGGRGLAVRNEAPSTGVIDGVTFLDCLLDQTNAVLGGVPQDMWVQREANTGAVRNITFDGLTVRAPRGRTLSVAGTAAYPVENVQIRRGYYPANPAATVCMELHGCVDPLLDGVTTDGGGTNNVILAGTVADPTKNLRIRNHRFIAVPGIANFSALSLIAAPGAHIADSKWAGGLAGTVVQAVRVGAASVNVLAENNDVTELVSTQLWQVLSDTRLRGNLGDAEDSGLQPLRENTYIVANAGTVQTLPNPRLQTVVHHTLSAATCAITVWPALDGLSSSLTIRQHSVTGSRLVTWVAPAGTTIKWATATGNPPTLSTATNKEDHFSLYCDRTGTVVIVPGPMGV